MTRFFEHSYTFTKIGFITTTLFNGIFIYLTLFHIRKITGTYKLMVFIFSLMGMLFSAWEIVAMPFAHNYNKALMYFSLNTWLGVSREFLRIAIILYASFYLVILAFIAVQFLFRYFTLCDQKVAKFFGGFGVIVWMSYCIICGALYGGALYFSCPPDDYSDGYLRNIVNETYDRPIEDIPRFLMVAYAADGSVRWRDLTFLEVGVSVMALQYIIIIFCGFKMNSMLQKELQQQSIVNRKLQKQFFTALVVQTVVPTLLFVLPIAPFVVGPLVVPVIGIEMNFQTGWMYVILCLYPPIDSIAFMLIVSEYKKLIFKKEIFKRFSSIGIKSGRDFSTSQATTHN